MTTRLAEVLTRLYRPLPDGTRQVFALSRAEAEKLPGLAHVAVISITAPERSLAALGDFEHLLRLSFADVDFENAELSQRARERLPHAFTPEQAKRICSFVESLPNAVSSIVVHCEGGYSRSCAIALGLHKLYGHQTALERLADANPSVLRVLLASQQPRHAGKKRR